jgi:hypothetical protein
MKEVPLKFLALLAILFPLTAFAADKATKTPDEGVPFYASAHELAAMCPAGGGSQAQQMACQNYVTGVVDAWSLVRINQPDLSKHLGCISQSARPSGLRQIVSDYLAKNPTVDKPAVFVVREAVLKAFPCRTK